MKPSDYAEKFMALANRELSGDEKTSFEAAIRDSPELLQEYRKHMVAHALLEAKISKDLKEMLASFPAPGATATVVRKIKPLLRYLAIAASVSLLIGFSTFFILKQQFAYNNLSTSFGMSPTEMRGNGSYEGDLLAQAGKFIAINDIESAAGILAGVTPDDDRYAMAQLLVGKAFFQVGKLNQSQKAFYLATTTQQRGVKEQGEYGLLLCSLGNNQWTIANQKTLERLAGDKTFLYANEASALLQKLRVAKYFHR